MPKEVAPQIQTFPKFDIVKYIPERQPISEFPVLFATGFGNNAESYALPMQTLADAGFTVVCPDYKLKAPNQPKRFLFLPDVDQAKEQSIIKTAEREGVPNAKGNKQVDVVAHSNGVPNIVRAALKHPENFRNLVFVAPGGIHEQMGPLKAISTLKENNEKDKLDKARIIRERPDLAELIGGNDAYKDEYKRDWMRYNLEGISAAIYRVTEHLPTLRNHGIKIAFIGLENDSMFNLDSIEQFMTSENKDYYLRLPGIHGEIKNSPEIAEKAAMILQHMALAR